MLKAFVYHSYILFVLILFNYVFLNLRKMYLLGLRSGFGLPVQVRWFGVPNRYRAEQVSSSGGSVLQYARMHLRVPTCLRVYSVQYASVHTCYVAVILGQIA